VTGEVFCGGLVGNWPAIYGEQAAAVVVFMYADYAALDWTGSSGGPC